MNLLKIFILSSLCLSTSSYAVDPIKAQQRAKQYACLSCHTTERKLVGPSYQDIAKKYANDKTASAKLAAKIHAGGSGVWGPIPMPANPALSDAHLKILVSWILAGAPKK
mgnify:FL=1